MHKKSYGDRLAVLISYQKRSGTLLNVLNKFKAPQTSRLIGFFFQTNW